MIEAISWLAALGCPFVAAWCVVEGRGVGALVAWMTGALAFVGFVLGALSLLGVPMTGNMTVATWLVGMVALLAMRQGINGIGVFVCRITGKPIPPKVQDAKHVPMEQLLDGIYAFTRE